MHDEDVQVSPGDFWVMLLSTIRYSLGRSTYMTGVAVELATTHAVHLSDHQLAQITREIDAEVARYRDRWGHIPDEDIWLKGAAALEAILKARQ